MQHGPTTPIYGYLAEFDDSHDLLAAIQKARAAGYEKLEAYTPAPLEDVIHALGHKNRMSAIVFCGGMTGTLSGFAMQYWMSAIDYPLNIGGRPYNSWPAFIVPAFEMTILFAALSAVFGMIILNGLPQPYHPLFNVPAFERASSDRLFLAIEAEDARFDATKTKEFLAALKPLSLHEVPQ
jgi:hypothetical protein